MKIVHIGLASYYTEGMTYQDNMLAEQNAKDGHDVIYISNAEKYISDNIVKTGYQDVVIGKRLRLIRLPYVKIFSNFFTKKIRKVKGLYDLLTSFEPDIIFCHELDFLSVSDVIRYKKEHQNVKFYADTHAAKYNSGTNWLSLHILHRVFYKRIIKKTIPYLDKYFYIGEEERLFSIANYGIPKEIMEFYPLGGRVLSDDEYHFIRDKRRRELGMNENELLFVHSGKINSLKRTVELLTAFSAVSNSTAKLLVIGAIEDDLKGTVLSLIDKDKRILYLGWKNGTELMEYLCACDVYCQPGSVSATMQNSICSRCALMLYPHDCYVKDYDAGNVMWVKNIEDMQKAFQTIFDNAVDLESMKTKSYEFATEFLDYSKLAAKIYY